MIIDHNFNSEHLGKTAVLITGPTAVGKTSFALNLAQELESEIISVDSVLTYKFFNIGSAKPSASELLRCMHHCVDIFDPDQKNSVAEWLKHAKQAYRDLVSRNKTPIFVGGSTMYITALLSGLTQLPSANIDLRERLEKQSSAELYQTLQERQPEKAEKLHANDRLRIIRALEVLDSNLNVHKSKLVQDTSAIPNILVIVLNMPREILYARINKRSQEMIEAGLIEETRKLYFDFPNSQALKSLGYSQCVEYLEGRVPIDNLSASIAQATRNYAKRQITYFRNEPLKNDWDINKNISLGQLRRVLNNQELRAYNFKESYLLSEEDLIQFTATSISTRNFVKPNICYFIINNGDSRRRSTMS